MDSTEAAPEWQQQPEDCFLHALSPDQNWVAIIHRNKLFLAPIHNSVAGPDDQWVQVTDGSDSVNTARWSPDGNLIYFVSNRDGHRCIWAQPLSPGTRRPEGQPGAVCHLHPPGPSLDHLSDEVVTFDISTNKLTLVLGEFTSTLFLFSR